MIRFLQANLKGYRALVALAIALTFLTVGADLAVSFPFKFMIDKVIHHQDPVVPFLGGLLDRFDGLGNRNALIDGQETHTQLGVIAFSLTLLVAIGAIGAFVTWAQLLIANLVGTRLSVRLRNQLFTHLEQLPLEWHNKQRTGDLVQRLTGNVQDIEKLVTDGLVDLLAGVLTLTGILAVMLLINWQFTLLTMGVMPPLFAIVLIYTKAIKKASKKTSKAAGQVSEIAAEDIGAIVEVKAFTLEDHASAHFGAAVERQRLFGFRAGRMQSEFAPLVLILVAISNALIISIGAWIAAGRGHSFTLGPLLIPEGSITIGGLTIFLLYSKQLYQPMRNLSKLANLASSAASGAERIREVLDQPVEEREPRVPYTGPKQLSGNLRFDGVYFEYEEGRPVLTGIHLNITTGRRVALVGLSGSGKTTLVKLVPRFHDVSKGAISIDGVDLRDIPLNDLRDNISLVLQDSVLFEGTVRENIALGRPNATDEQIAEAARKAYIHETISMLPDGYMAHVREQGRNFSGGQRQRLAIARAILRDAPILILDEPTASLDVEAEAEVMRALETLVKGRTVLMISHRLSTLGNVDEIVVLKAGLIVEQGTYDELIDSGGEFARLIEEQSRYSAERTRGKKPLRVIRSDESEEAPPPLGPAPWQRLLRGEVQPTSRWTSSHRQPYSSPWKVPAYSLGKASDTPGPEDEELDK